MGLLGFSLIGRITPRGSPGTTAVSFCASLVRGSGSTAEEMHRHSSSPLQSGVHSLLFNFANFILYSVSNAGQFQF